MNVSPSVIPLRDIHYRRLDAVRKDPSPFLPRTAAIHHNSSGWENNVKGVAHSVWDARCSIAHTDSIMDDNVQLHSINASFHDFEMLMDNEVQLEIQERARQARLRRQVRLTILRVEESVENVSFTNFSRKRLRY